MATFLVILGVIGYVGVGAATALLFTYVWGVRTNPVYLAMIVFWWLILIPVAFAALRVKLGIYYRRVRTDPDAYEDPDDDDCIIYKGVLTKESGLKILRSR